MCQMGFRCANNWVKSEIMDTFVIKKRHTTVLVIIFALIRKDNMEITAAQVFGVLRTVVHPELKKDIIQLDLKEA